ncbi:MAG: phospholipid carrier-dependent glycosyltransferase [Anaerolineae bacterium]|nr:phospholipid carrier-dependent glycosyltransferase [Anaerolineae bacterium]
MKPSEVQKSLQTGLFYRAARRYLRVRWASFAILLALMAVYAASLLLSATSVYGIGIRSDSVAYIWSARNLAEGIGLGRMDGGGNFKAMTHWPPLYPVVLAAFPLFGMDVIEGARWLGAILGGLNVALVGWMLARITRSPWFAAGGALIVLFSPAMAETNLQAMTEPLYISLSLLALLFLDTALLRGRRRWLLAAAVFTALALLTRYVGLSLVLAGALGILIYERQTLGRRGRDLAIFLAIAVLPAGLWALRNLALSGSAANRALTFYAIPVSDFALAFETMQGWVSPASEILSVGAGKLILALVALLGGFLLARFGSFGEENGPRSTLIDLNQLLLGFYLMMVLVSRLFFDPLITIFEQRILAPAYLSVLALLTGILFAAWHSAVKLRWWIGAILAIFYLWSAYSFAMIYRSQSNQIYNTMRENGSGYAYKGELDSPFAKLLRQIPDRAVVFTSNVEKFYFLTGKPSYGYPSEFDAAFIKSVKAMMVDRTVFFVSFHRENESWLVIREQLTGLRTVYEDENSYIYSNLQPVEEK